MREELDPTETSELARLIDQWRERTIAEATISFLEVYAVNDDLALSARIHARMLARERRA